MPYISALDHPAAADGRRPVPRAALEGGRGRAAQDHPVHALRHRRPVARPELLHQHRPRAASRRRAARRSCFEPGLGLPPDDDDHADLRHRVHHVARRADHRARHRQRHLADHLRRHRRRRCRRRSRTTLAVRARGRAVSSSSCSSSLLLHGRASSRRSSSWSAASGASRCSTRSASSAGGCTAARARTCRSRSTPSGVIPPIFASSILLFPGTIAELRRPPVGARRSPSMLAPGSVALQPASTSALIIFFCYFYTAVTFNPVDVADNMKKFGGYIPGIRPGPADRRVHRPHPDAHHARRRALRRRPSACCRPS